jgi:retinol dehydrogenase-12
MSKIESAIEQVYKDVPSYRGKIDGMQLDLSSFDNTIKFCEKVRADKGRLDIVLANAGVYKAQYTQTVDGHEEVMQVNGLSTGLMATLLLPKLEETADLPAPEASKGMKPSMCIVASEGEYLTSSCVGD